MCACILFMTLRIQLLQMTRSFSKRTSHWARERKDQGICHRELVKLLLFYSC